MVTCGGAACGAQAEVARGASLSARLSELQEQADKLTSLRARMSSLQVWTGQGVGTREAKELGEDLIPPLPPVPAPQQSIFCWSPPYLLHWLPSGISSSSSVVSLTLIALKWKMAKTAVYVK
eukprot:355484-Chlamydomonas_euryale.AAC.2